MSQKEENKKLAIITAFMGYTLENDHYPKSVYKFCKINEIEKENSDFEILFNNILVNLQPIICLNFFFTSSLIPVLTYCLKRYSCRF